MQRVEKDKAIVDEFTLYCLGRMYNKHVVVLTHYEPWSTLSRQFQLALPDVYVKSHVRLIYLGPGKYAEIRPNRETATPWLVRIQSQNCPHLKQRKGGVQQKMLNGKEPKLHVARPLPNDPKEIQHRPKRKYTLAHHCKQLEIGNLD